jgi:hypothetical protein
METASIDTQPQTDSKLVEFFLRSELRRTAYWAIGGSLLIVAVMWLITGRLVPARPKLELVAISLPLLLLCAVIFPYFSAVIRVDHVGVYQRLLWKWEAWPWEVFTNGLVSHGFGSRSYRCTSLKNWSKKLDLSILNDEDADEVAQLIRKVWKLPAPIPAASQLTLKLNWPDSRTITISADGISVTRRESIGSFPWNTIDVDIWRRTDSDPAFVELQLQLPNAPIRLQRHMVHGQVVSTWSAASVEEIAATILQYASPDRLRDFALVGPARSIGEVEARLNRLDQKLMEMKKVQKWCFLVGWATTVSPLFWMRWPNCLFMVGFTSLFMAGMHAIGRLHRREVDEARLVIERDRQALIDTASVSLNAVTLAGARPSFYASAPASA